MDQRSETKDLGLKKTKLIAYSSCMQQKLEDHDEFRVQRKDSAKANDGLELQSNNDEDDDVFLLDKPRRASEPVFLKRNGNAMVYRSGRQKPSVLRSLSEGIPVPADRPRAQPRKLARSASSGSNTQTSPSQFFSFSPKIVRKINLSTSLQDWLDNEKQARHKLTKNNDTCLEQNLEKSMSNYRRYSADRVGKKSENDERRRPSAPPALSGKENCEKYNVQVQPYVTPCLHSTDKFDSIYEFQIHSLIKEQLKSRLGPVEFSAQLCRKWCEEISEVIKEGVQVLLNTQCKVICLVYIGALRDYGIGTASQATLNHKLDYHVSACYQNESLFAAVSVLVVRYASR